MLFTSIQFLIFFPLAVFAFFVFPKKFRWVILLGASYYYYMSWRPKYLLLLLALTIFSYVVGLLLDREQRPVVRRIFLTAGILASLGMLFLFKYFSFFGETLQILSDQIGMSISLPAFTFLLPIGISFYTLQTMSYMIDIYKGVIKAERHPGIYALFVAFFPQLVSGPIARANQLLPQLHQFQSPEYEALVRGLQRMAWGFFKKLVIADRLALLVNTVYGDPMSYSGLPLLIATYAFTIQIYCDFSGYADIAIGAASVMGIRLQENFQQPYLARSVPDFWRRWHISLSNWLRDYVFYPLSRSVGRSRLVNKPWLNTIIPPMLTMAVSGLWHGADWTFVFWGLLHGLFMVVTVSLNRSKKFFDWFSRLPPAITTGLSIFVTFNLVALAWIFFRANSLTDAAYILTHLFTNIELNSSLFELMPGGKYEFVIAGLAILVMELVHWLERRDGSVRSLALRQPLWIRWLAYYGLVLSILMFGKLGLTEFIYFQF